MHMYLYTYNSKINLHSDSIMYLCGPRKLLFTSSFIRLVFRFNFVQINYLLYRLFSIYTIVSLR